MSTPLRLSEGVLADKSDEQCFQCCNSKNDE